MSNPYENLPPTRYLKTGVSEQHPFQMPGLYKRKFRIGADLPIATAGSCFAQHIGTNLRANGYNVLDLEPAAPGMTDATAKRYGYRTYSARYGNLYTARQLLQLAKEALGLEERHDIVWTQHGRFFDALRPNVEPNGFENAEELCAHRRRHLQRVATMLKTMKLFIFTLGLTETWVNTEHGTVYPTAPGVIAGTWDPTVYAFKNLRHSEVLADMLEFMRIVQAINPGMKYLITVSPVPLTATATKHHVLAATTYSKSVLRAVAGELADSRDNVDYFPSYEIIAAPSSRGFFYSPNLRSVEHEGVKTVMRTFFSEHTLPKSAGRANAVAPTIATRKGDDDVVCEEVLLEAFAK